MHDRALTKEKVYNCESTRTLLTVAGVACSSITAAIIGVEPQLLHLLFKRLHQAPRGALKSTLKQKHTHTQFSCCLCLIALLRSKFSVHKATISDFNNKAKRVKQPSQSNLLKYRRQHSCESFNTVFSQLHVSSHLV